jgi:toxin YhaV
MEVNGWRLYLHPLFQQQLEKLTAQVEALQARDPAQYKEQPATKLLATINRYIREIIPREPNAAEFRQGNTLGADNRHWFRAKFHERYRLFYRFSSKEKVIVYAWVNDENTLRKAGSKTDPYSVFRTMLDAGDPPGTMAELLAASAKIGTGGSSQQQQAASKPRKKSNR